MDVDDLIRVADEALDGIVTGMWPPALDGYEWQGDANFIAAAPDLVRRLRDALIAEHFDHGATLAAVERLRRDAAESRAALAEAREATSGMCFSSWLEDQQAALAEACAAIRNMQENSLHRGTSGLKETIERLASDVGGLAFTREEANERVRQGYGCDYINGWDQAVENAVHLIRGVIEEER